MAAMTEQLLRFRSVILRIAWAWLLLQVQVRCSDHCWKSRACRVVSFATLAVSRSGWLAASCQCVGGSLSTCQQRSTRLTLRNNSPTDRIRRRLRYGLSCGRRLRSKIIRVSCAVRGDEADTEALLQNRTEGCRPVCGSDAYVHYHWQRVVRYPVPYCCSSAILSRRFSRCRRRLEETCAAHARLSCLSYYNYIRLGLHSLPPTDQKAPAVQALCKEVDVCW